MPSDKDNASASGGVDPFRAAYDDTRQYHLTSAAGKLSIREHGFNLSKKEGNSAEAIGFEQDAVDRCKVLHYVSSTRPKTGSSDVTREDRVAAKRLPLVVTQAHGMTDPKVVRVMVDRSELSPDVDFMTPDGYGPLAYTMGNQPVDAVLRAHGSEPLERAVEVYRRNAELHLKRRVSTAEAKTKLMEYQSDSEDDADDL